MVEIFDNIRKLYRFTCPCPELLPHIEFFSETAPEAMQHYIGEAPFTVKMFPSYTPTIWLNLGSSYQLKNGSKLQLIDAHTDVLVLRSDIVERRNLPTDNIFTIKFHPGGFEAIFGHPQQQIGPGVINVNQLIPETLLQQIKKMDGFDRRIQAVESWLLDKLCRQKKRYNHLLTVQKIIETFTASGMQLNNQQLASQHHLTEKTLYRHFTQAIGTNPKNYFGTLRARTALTAYMNNKAQFEYKAHGYYDASHFYKEVVKFTGRRLNEFRS
jgi:AraC-like DNA-binding protein